MESKWNGRGLLGSAGILTLLALLLWRFDGARLEGSPGQSPLPRPASEMSARIAARGATTVEPAARADELPSTGRTAISRPRCDGTERYDSELEALVQAWGHPAQDLRGDASRGVVGRVVWPDFRPAVGAWLWVEGRHSSTARADARGHFELELRDQGPHTLIASTHQPVTTLGSNNPVEIDWGSPRARMEEVQGRGQVVLLVLRTRPSLSGRVVDEAGELRPGAKVHAQREWASADGSAKGRSGRTVDAPDGIFRFDALPEGNYELFATVSRRGSLTARVGLSQSVSDMVLVVPRQGPAPPR